MWILAVNKEWRLNYRLCQSAGGIWRSLLSNCDRPCTSILRQSSPILTLFRRMDYFLPYTLVTGFFLNIPRFINSLYSPGLLGDHSRPCPALLSTVYLWGLKLSACDSLTAYEPVFLARAIRHVSSGLSIDHPQKAKHAIQAEALLSHYFYWCGRVLEGRYHCNAAVSIAISLGSHRIRSSRGPLCNPASVDPIEEGERINSFWAVFLNDKCWSVAMNVSSALPDHKALNGRIDTPWPLDMVQYEKVKATGCGLENCR